ncbi:MAG TPA: M28 family peptidase [Candidatus Thermoplasmatota archaeon]|nr:M28 family peptidase [Candidatus Thermoplasmatota archaeon]
MRIPSVLAAATVLVAVLAGCADGPKQDTTLPDEGCTGASACAPPAAAPQVDAGRVLAELKAFGSTYVYRQSGTPMHQAARDYMAAEFETAGLEVVRQPFPASFLGGNLPYDGENVVGIKWGNDRSHWIVVGAHYDITEGAVHGTYDDGSGTVDVLALARAFAGVPTERTIAFIEFDQEERGLVGSRFFVESTLDQAFQYDVTVDGMVDLDMVGITWPHPAHLVVWENSLSLESRVKTLAGDVGVPGENLEFRKPGGGSSDGAAFIEANIATAYFWSDWDEVVLPNGMPYPDSYPWWHQADTYETMVVMAGSEATLQAGFQTTLDIVSPLLLHMASPGFIPDPEEAET